MVSVHVFRPSPISVLTLRNVHMYICLLVLSYTDMCLLVLSGRRIFGDPALGAINLRMIAIAQANDAAAKFPGSGGCVVGFCDTDKVGRLRGSYEKEGFVFSVIKLHTGERGTGASSQLRL